MELISSLTICTFEANCLFLSYLVYNSCFFVSNYFFFFSYSSCLAFKSSCFFLMFSCLSVIYFILFTSISIFVLSIFKIYLSKSSISFSKSLIYLFIFSIFCSLCLKFYLLSCSCFFRCCFKKQKSHDRSLLIFLRLHSPHIELAQIRLYLVEFYQWWRFTPLWGLNGCLQMLHISAFANYSFPLSLRPGTFSMFGALFDW